MRGSARARGYGAKWRRESRRYKRDHPWCVMCKDEGMIRQVYAVDHIIPHKGDSRLMWDQENWQSLCQEHHNRTKKNIETRGYSTDVGPDGIPTDPRHPAHRKNFFISGGE